jgi:NodT family efflux transporter outer membrane factor (OMF) lipoprotein
MIRAFSILLIATTLLENCAPISQITQRVRPISNSTIGLERKSSNISARWWTMYGDLQLNRLIVLGLADNPTLETALARVRVAQAEIGLGHASLLPQVNSTALTSRAHIGEKLLPSPLGGRTANLVTAGASFSWDLDLFGRQRAMVWQLTASAQASFYDAAAAHVAVSASIAQTYISLAQAYAQIKIANDFVEIRHRSLVLIQQRERNDLASQLDIETAKTLLAEAEQSRIRAQQERDLLIHALAALVGRGADFYPEISSPTLPLDKAPTVPDALPADLLTRRPDLLASRALIESALSGRKAAAAAFLPDVNIVALAGLASFGFGNFLTAGAGSWAGGPAISLPIFDGGRLRAQYKVSTASLDVSVADYNNAVLNAIREAADAITEVKSTDRDVLEQTRVLDGLRSTVRLDQVRIATGLDSRLDAIDSGFRLLEVDQDLIRLQADALTSRVRLIAALGGDFSSHAHFTAISSSDSKL